MKLFIVFFLPFHVNIYPYILLHKHYYVLLPDAHCPWVLFMPNIIYFIYYLTKIWKVLKQILHHGFWIKDLQLKLFPFYI